MQINQLHPPGTYFFGSHSILSTVIEPLTVIESPYALIVAGNEKIESAKSVVAAG